MGAGKYLAILAGLLTILGTWVFALWGSTGAVGSGVGFVVDLDTLFADAETYATGLSLNIILYYLLIVLFLIFLAAGVLQLIGIKSRVAIIIFSLFPLTIGVIYLIVFYGPSDIFGNLTLFFTIVFLGEQYGDLFPFLVQLGDVALGTYLLVAGGVLGIVSGILPREEYY
jgi:hypothetical protein